VDTISSWTVFIVAARAVVPWACFLMSSPAVRRVAAVSAQRRHHRARSVDEWTSVDYSDAPTDANVPRPPLCCCDLCSSCNSSTSDVDTAVPRSHSSTHARRSAAFTRRRSTRTPSGSTPGARQRRTPASVPAVQPSPATPPPRPPPRPGHRASTRAATAAAELARRTAEAIADQPADTAAAAAAAADAAAMGVEGSGLGRGGVSESTADTAMLNDDEVDALVVRSSSRRSTARRRAAGRSARRAMGAGATGAVEALVAAASAVPADDPDGDFDRDADAAMLGSSDSDNEARRARPAERSAFDMLLSASEAAAALLAAKAQPPASSVTPNATSQPSPQAGPTSEPAAPTSSSATDRSKRREAAADSDADSSSSSLGLSAMKPSPTTPGGAVLQAVSAFSSPPSTLPAMRSRGVLRQAGSPAVPTMTRRRTRSSGPASPIPGDVGDEGVDSPSDGDGSSSDNAAEESDHSATPGGGGASEQQKRARSSASSTQGRRWVRKETATASVTGKDEAELTEAQHISHVDDAKQARTDEVPPALRLQTQSSVAQEPAVRGSAAFLPEQAHAHGENVDAGAAERTAAELLAGLASSTPSPQNKPPLRATPPIPPSLFSPVTKAQSLTPSSPPPPPHLPAATEPSVPLASSPPTATSLAAYDQLMSLLGTTHPTPPTALKTTPTNTTTAAAPTPTVAGSSTVNPVTRADSTSPQSSYLSSPALAASPVVTRASSPPIDSSSPVTGERRVRRNLSKSTRR